MAIRPNMNEYKRLYDATYGDKSSIRSVEEVNELIEGLCAWQTIENETDKDLWFFAVQKEEVEINEAEESFVIGYFADCDPWKLCQDVKDTDGCIAINVWMDTARKLVRQHDGIRVLVNPDVLKIICPDMDANVKKVVKAEDGDEDSSDSMQKRKVEDEDDDLTDDEVANVLQPRGFGDDE